MLFNFHLDENSWKAEAEIDMELFHQVLQYFFYYHQKKILTLFPKKNQINLSLFLCVSRNNITFLQVRSLVSLVEYHCFGFTRV